MIPCSRASSLLALFAGAAIGAAVPRTAHAQDFSFTRIADTSMAMPGAGADFARFFDDPAIDGDLVSFRALDQESILGAYSGIYEIPIGGALEVVVDSSTTFGGSTPGTLNIGAPSIEGSSIVFHATAIGGPPSYPDLADALYSDRTGSLSTVATDAEYNSFTDDPFFDAGGILFPVSKSGGGYGLILDVDGVQGEVVSSGDPMPGTSGSYDFLQFVDPVVDGSQIAFSAISPAATIEGVYADLGAGLVRVADNTTAVPDGTGSFTNLLLGVSLDGGVVSFIGGWGGTGLNGIYRSDGVGLEKVLDFHDPAPTGGQYRVFLDLSTDAGHLAFSHNGLGTYGIFTDLRGSIETVIATGDSLDGKTVEWLGIGRESLSGNRIAFFVHFNDNSEGIYVATAPTPVPSAGPFAVLALALLLASSGSRWLRSSAR